MCEFMSMSPLVRKALLCWCLALAAPVMVVGQTNYYTNGVEYSIAGTLAGDQVNPQVSINTSGGYIVWEDNLTDGNGLGVSARRLDNTLSGWLAPFRVNSNGTNDQERPQVAMLRNGGAVFAWQGGKRSYQRIYARFLKADNTWVTPSSDVLVNTFTNNFQVNPAVTVLANSNVVVTWGSFNQFSSSSLQDIYGQVLTSTGQKVGGEFLINQFTSFNQRTPAVTTLSDGRFVVAWVSEQQRFANSVDIYARIFNANGSSGGNEIAVSSGTNVCANPNLLATQNGGFIVAWSEKDLRSPQTNSWEVLARAFSSTGSALGADTRLNQVQFGDQFAPKLAGIGLDVLATWTSLNQDGSGAGVFGRFLGSNLTPKTDEFVVNTRTPGDQFNPAVASDGLTRFLVLWSGFTGVAGGFDLFAQRYGSNVAPPPAPAAPFVAVLSSNALMVSWAAVAGYAVSNYNVYADGAGTPTATVTNLWWTMSGLQPGSTHYFQLDYVLADGRHSLISGATTNTTYDILSWGGIPYDWMKYYFGTDVFAWPSPYADSDGDGVSNLNEFLAGTSPTNNQSVLRVGLQPTQLGVYVNWNTQPGLIYQLQSSVNLGGWTNVGGPRFAPGTTDSVYMGSSSRGYFRVVRVR